MNDTIKTMQQSAGPKDWPEDFIYENGCYEGVCYICKGHFIGGRRKVICKECALK